MLAAALVLLLTYFAYLIFRQKDDILQFLHVRKICTREFKKLRGPPAVLIFGTLWYFKKDPVEMVYQAQAWFSEYTLAPDNCGVLKLWLGPIPAVNIARGEIAKIVLDSSVNISKSSQYNKLKEWIGDGLLISTGDKWRSRRKMLTQTFHFAVLKEYQKIFGAQGKILVEVLQLRANNKFSFDIMPYIKRCALDIICETAMGCSISSQRGANDEYVNSVRRLSEIVWNYEKAPQFWLKPIWYLFGDGFEFNRHVKLTTDFTRDVIENRKKELKTHNSEQNETKKLAFLDYLLKSQEEHPDILTDEGIREEVDTFMFEGHDTTSSGITFAVWFLGQFPEYQQRVHDELDEIFGEDFERIPNSEDIQKMVYLEQCIKETLRMTPPVPFVSRKLTEDVKIPHATKPDLLLPAGINCMINIITIMKDARYFERPYEFFPEHFSPERVAAREPFAFVPFSAGPRNCIGQKFALLEEKVLLSWIFRNFTVTSMTKFPEEMPIPELILKPQFGTQVLLRNRRKL
ncbi:Cytochrome P450 4c3 [Caenorhabditis elegans]|uniref:Cytochrome P450 4c3 n=1 Tax=Caenorhabditis elegans TaxID=6239 RepID=Q9N4Q5_CAEEL|nr:Cytochrome P450 4c3 [Caenorhabditis elegans]CCD67436.1 Cytochrome P450 4c3 [Caenorhabditis elegans]|eukprot:NP_503598.1 CYtochrome P450 family [Caenorhabditis elegans]